jgi:hypothetical protein
MRGALFFTYTLCSLSTIVPKLVMDQIVTILNKLGLLEGTQVLVK